MSRRAGNLRPAQHDEVLLDRRLELLLENVLERALESASRYFWSIAFAFAVLLSVLLSSLLRNEMYFEPITPRYAPKKARTVVVAVVR